MLKASYMVGLFAGVLLIYLGLFGISGLPTFAIAPDLVQQDWNTLGSWANYAGGSIEPAGQLRLRSSMQRTPTDSIGMVHYAMWVPTQVTLEVKMMLDNVESPGFVQLAVISEQNQIYGIAIRPDNIGLSGGQTLNLQTQIGQWYVWTITVDDASTKMVVYRDSSKVLEGTPAPSGGEVYNLMHAVRSPTQYGTEAHFDYTYLSTGIIPPSGTPPPDTGTILLYAWDGTAFVSASLSITFPDSTQMAASTPYKNTQAPTGNYYVLCSYSTKTLSHSFTLAVGDTETYAFDFTEGESPPPTDGGGLEWLLEILNNPALRTFMVLCGIGMSGVCGILLIVPSKSKPS